MYVAPIAMNVCRFTAELARREAGFLRDGVVDLSGEVFVCFCFLVYGLQSCFPPCGNPTDIVDVVDGIVSRCVTVNDGFYFAEGEVVSF